MKRVVIVLTLLLAACGAGASRTPVEYACEGDADNVLITYSDADGTLITEETALPWTHNHMHAGTEFDLALTAIVDSDLEGVSCFIAVDDSIAAQAGDPTSVALTVRYTNGEIESGVEVGP